MNKKIAILWFIASLIFSVMNDAITKYVNLPAPEITFFRFFFATMSLVPFIMSEGVSSIIPKNFFVQLSRGLILFFAMSFWAFGLNNCPLALATIVSFTVPIFVLILARIFLQENITATNMIATIIGFIGIIITADVSSFDLSIVWFLIAAFLFASLDIVNKKFILTETMTTMLFYSAAVTSVFSLLPAIYVWQTPEMIDILLLLLLGIGGNAILYCILKAFMLVNASFLAPFRYLELILSMIVGFFFFQEEPTAQLLIGGIIIISSTLFIVWSNVK